MGEGFQAFSHQIRIPRKKKLYILPAGDVWGPKFWSSYEDFKKLFEKPFLELIKKNNWILYIFFRLVAGILGPQLFKKVRGTGRIRFHLISSQSDHKVPSYNQQSAKCAQVQSVVNRFRQLENVEFHCFRSTPWS